MRLTTYPKIKDFLAQAFNEEESATIAHVFYDVFFSPDPSIKDFQEAKTILQTVMNEEQAEVLTKALHVIFYCYKKDEDEQIPEFCLTRTIDEARAHLNTKRQGLLLF
jgi:DNA-binding phage protein